ncbi:hypothetical protein FHS29_001792 [Saccharothrix tamanrassetensis]|uniref:Uncharacterized protein n=1 Tax=Saccharothrix tamanrassetensis TaxID=1051531 RepID=A0A841C9L6_9PSEU|nr:hypothetical protein [Saccharothrix tamanrassetensis]MBB5955222.1 hypothetical protein [Saccharothrix tamanrassetensis]
MNTEDLIRDALRRQADLAPPPGPVLAALHRPRRRRKPLYLVLATAGTAAVVAIAATTFSRPTADAPPAGSNRPPFSTVTGSPSPTGVPSGKLVSLEYAPTWLPDGFVEWRRSLFDHGWQRTWRQAPPDHSPSAPALTFEITRGSIGSLLESADEPANRTTVNGAPGVYTDDGLRWQVADKLVLTVNLDNVPDARGTIRRIAESVRPDRRQIRVPVSFGGSTRFTVSANSRDDWTASTDVSYRDGRYMAMLHSVAHVGSSPRTVTALGREASYEEAGGGVLTIPLAPDRFLSVGGLGLSGFQQPVPVETLTEVAALVEVDLGVDLSWLGV